MTTAAEITAQGIEAIRNRVNTEGSEVTGAYDEDAEAWTWLLTVPAPTEEAPEGMQGVSRQFAASEDAPEPPEGYLELMATEMASSLAPAPEE